MALTFAYVHLVGEVISCNNTHHAPAADLQREVVQGEVYRAEYQDKRPIDRFAAAGQCEW